jgi:hypothetical protein
MNIKRKDVVEYRKNFLNKILQYKKYMPIFKDKNIK